MLYLADISYICTSRTFTGGYTGCSRAARWVPDDYDETWDGTAFCDEHRPEEKDDDATHA